MQLVDEWAVESVNVRWWNEERQQYWGERVSVWKMYEDFVSSLLRVRELSDSQLSGQGGDAFRPFRYLLDNGKETTIQTIWRVGIYFFPLVHSTFLCARRKKEWKKRKGGRKEGKEGRKEEEER